ncbi:hypothetical protein FSP39_014737 [Pinctada imbricata]|uniref:MACPF domain-containing protein n=1 Tax=Pinctada imbricata TaxID=66713 RepID=A0AA88Y0L9_PINIB|nr:hypothetical protein FSP39_014737 [Pinctada imbricata]
MLLAVSVIIFGVCVSHVLGEDAPNQTYGGINACLSNPVFKNTIRYEVLPGMGWDNLRNKNAGLLVDYSYSQCRTTDDGKYLLPDCVVTVPIKKSNIETYAEIFEHWSNYTSMTARSINIDEEILAFDYSFSMISGTFSEQFQHVKMQQVNEKSFTTRVQARYVRYAARLRPDSPLSPEFKNRLYNIAINIMLNNTAMAKYESELLVRDFGTHVVTNVESGAIVGRTDEIKSSFSRSEEDSKSKILATASAIFYNDDSKLSLSSEYYQVTNKDFIDQYLSNRTHSEIFSQGGPVYKPINFSLDAWVDGIGNSLVAVDRSGDPIYFLISPQTLPYLSPSILFYLTEYVKAAVETYYKFNAYRGCTKADSPNFSFIANVDDGTCESPYSNYSFGGVYQTCSQVGLPNKNLCSGLEQINPLTGGFSCPEGYEAVLINEGGRETSEPQRSCDYALFIKLQCTDYFAWGVAFYSSYWCVARGSVPQQSGFEFGGLYTDKVPNLLTGSKSCPLFFYPLKMGESLKICVSDDFELGYRYSVPFAGFFSCVTGNPLMVKNSNRPLAIYLGAQSNWPKGCPNGYSSHLAAIENGCEINYCVQSQAFSGRGLPPIRRPPFINLPPNGYVVKGIKYNVNITRDYNTWTNKVPEESTGNTAGENKAVMTIIAGILIVTEVLK